MATKKKGTTKVNKQEQERAAAVAQEAEEQKPMEAEDLKIGYAVGMTPDGEFVFQVFGQDPGLVELLGVHRYAEMLCGCLNGVSLGAAPLSQRACPCSRRWSRWRRRAAHSSIRAAVRHLPSPASSCSGRLRRPAC